MVRKLSIEQQIESVLPKNMTNVPIIINESNFDDSDRKAYLIYITEMKTDVRQINMTNRTLYIEGTLPRLEE